MAQTPKSSTAQPRTATGQQGASASGQKLSPQERRKEIINTWERAREKEIEFWGKIVDQHNDPVAGASVTATVATHQIPPTDYKPQPTTIYSTISDAAGLFYIKGRVGRGFTIETMQKTGYVLNDELQKRRENLYWYNYDQLDPKSFKSEQGSPVVFRMWKLGAPEPLVSQQVDTRIPYDGAAINFDLLTGRKTSSGGDMRVSLVRNPQSITWGQRNYDWTATIEAIDGGLIESNEEFMYLAPDAGYQPRLVIHMMANDPQWTEEKALTFYLKSCGGKHYGRVKVDFMTGSDKPTTGFFFESVLNAGASRDLESNPMQPLTKSAR